ncbi:MAG: hypothetical protein Q9195_005832 [Heterodermia aff. obscurata]
MATLGYIRNRKLILVPTFSERSKPKTTMSAASTMRGDDASIAPSQAETLTPERDEAQRFTATGRPTAYPRREMLTPNSPTVPTKFTDESILNIPIPYSAIYPPEEGAEVKKERKGSFLGKLKGGGGRKKEGFKMVKMTRREYLMYWYVLPAASCL